LSSDVSVIPAKAGIQSPRTCGQVGIAGFRAAFAGMTLASHLKISVDLPAPLAQPQVGFPLCGVTFGRRENRRVARGFRRDGESRDFEAKELFQISPDPRRVAEPFAHCRVFDKVTVLDGAWPFLFWCSD
jgi:hypothetical protein